LRNKITEGFVKDFGRNRVRNTPICESIIVSTAMGLSIKGMKAVVEMQFADFVSSGAKGLLNTAINDPNPVLFFEHKGLYRSVYGDVPEDYYTLPFGEASILKTGESVSIVTYGAGVHWALETLEKHSEVDADLIDLRTLQPLDTETIYKSVQKTGRLLILQEDSLFGGIASDISALVMENCFEYLDSSIVMYFNVIIIGGGLAGLTAAMHLRKEGLRVLVVEKNTYPNHKVCGEYVSNEVKPYLEYLGIDLDSVGVVAIDTLQISTRSGKAIKTKLPLGGFGISRYALDNLLYKNALELGVEFTFKTVADVLFDNDKFEITLSSNTKLVGNVVIGAFGKRSNLDKKLNRKFIQQKSPWLGVKCHYNYKDFPENLVALHNFYGGYGGLSKTEDGSVNFCYLTNFKSFQKHKIMKDIVEKY